MLTRVTKIALLCGLSVSLLACGDDDDKNNTSTNNTSTNNTTNNNTTATNNETNNNTTTTNNETNNVQPAQCTAVGQNCTIGEPTQGGFVCADPGDGAKCFSACTPPAEGAQYPCPSGQACGALTQGGATMCIVSQCNGWSDHAGCDRFQFPNSGTCAGGENNSFLCYPAGAAAKGDACANTSACGSGLICFEGTCTNICTGDAQCTDGDSCLGDADADFLDQGVGLCGPRCENYSLGQCGEGLGCYPAFEDEGFCTEVGDKVAYSECANNAECGEGTSCVRFEQNAANGFCMPICAGGLEDQAAADATCPGMGDYCLEAFDAPAWQSGICYAGCTVDDYGLGTCEGNFSCRPISGVQHACQYGGAGNAEVGEPCAADGVGTRCVESAFCEPNGAAPNAGVCRAFCDLRTENPNDLLRCETDEICDPIGPSIPGPGGEEVFAFGRCALPCSGEGYADTANCPENLQTCRPGDPRICEASGDNAVGTACGSIISNECTPGATCVNGLNLGVAGQPALSMPGTCRNLCDPFADNTGCAATEACVVDWLFLSTDAGYCEPLGQPAPTPTAYGDCATPNTACGDRAFCIQFTGQPSGTCLYFCDPDRGNMGDNCPSGSTCTTQIRDPNTGENISFEFGEYALCLPNQ